MTWVLADMEIKQGLHSQILGLQNAGFVKQTETAWENSSDYGYKKESYFPNSIK